MRYDYEVWSLFHCFSDNTICLSLCLSQGYQLHGTDYRGLVSSYKVEYSYDGNHWIAYVDSAKNSASQGYSVSGFLSVNNLFVRPDFYNSWFPHLGLIDRYFYSWE